MKKVLGIAAIGLLLTGCATGESKSAVFNPETDVELVREIEWDNSIFTQGLEADKEKLLVSSGLYGSSSIFWYDTETKARVNEWTLSEDEFAEGATIVDDVVWQITWENGKAYKRDKESLSVNEEVAYEGQGWGLCYNGKELVMTDGSQTLQFRDKETFELLRTVDVSDSRGWFVKNLNEIECQGDMVIANEWQTNKIHWINSYSGKVVKTQDLTQIVQESAGKEGADVMNGLAVVDEGLLVTGKLWDKAYIVKQNCLILPRTDDKIETRVLAFQINQKYRDDMVERVERHGWKLVDRIVVGSSKRQAPRGHNTRKKEFEEVQVFERIQVLCVILIKSLAEQNERSK